MTSVQNFYNASGDHIGYVNMMYQIVSTPRKRLSLANSNTANAFALELPYMHDKVTTVFLSPLDGNFVSII